MYLLILLFLASSSLAQINVSGKVITTDDIPVTATQVKLVASSDSTQIFSAITDSLGQFHIVISSIQQEQEKPQSFSLFPNYPNPFSEYTLISYQSTKISKVEIMIYDILGREVRKLEDRVIDPGIFSVPWDGTDDAKQNLSPGVYFYALKFSTGVLVKKMVFLGKLRFPSQGLIQSLIPANENAPKSKFESNTYRINVLSTPESNILFRRNTFENIQILNDTSLTLEVSKLGSTDWEFLGLNGKSVWKLVLAGDSLYACAGKDGLYRTNLEKSMSWDYLGLGGLTVPPGYDGYGVRDLIVKPGKKSELIVGFTTYADTTRSGIYYSDNYGLTWTPRDSNMRVPNYPYAQVNSLATNQGVYFAGTFGAIYRSVDQAVTWEPIYGILDGGLGINSIATRKIKNLEIWAGGQKGSFWPNLVMSADGGVSWREVLNQYSFTETSVNNIILDPVDTNIVYLGFESGLLKTTNGGQTWSSVGGRTASASVNPGFPSELFATSDGIYRTSDGYQHIQYIALPITQRNLISLAVDWNKRILFASANYQGGYGIYRISF